MAIKHTKKLVTTQANIGKGSRPAVPAALPNAYSNSQGTAPTVVYTTTQTAAQKDPPKSLVSIKAIEKNFVSQQVLKGIDLELKAGTITGLLGPSGCGKTTLVNIIIGCSRATAGSATVLGEKPPFTRARPRMGFMPQSEALYNDLTATQNLRFFGSLYQLTLAELDERIPRTLELVRLEDTGRKTVASFSGGMKRRLSLAVALLHKPHLLVLDEPTVGLDPEHRLQLWSAFRDLAATGSGLLVTTHVMDEAASCDTLVMLRDGKVLAQGSPTQLMQQTKAANLEEAFLHYERSGG